MERTTTTAMKTFDCNLAPKSPPTTLRDRDASFSSYLMPEKPNTCQPPHHHHHHAAGSGRCSGALDDSTSELSIFDAHKYFNEVVTNNNVNDIQKVTISSSISNSNNSSRVSPMVVNVNNNMDNERIVIPETTTRYSSASSSVDGYSSIRNYRAGSFHAATPTASSEASWNSQQGLLSHPPGAISVSMRNPPNPNPNDHLNSNKLRASLSKPIWLLRRKCPCSGKKSVQVKEKKTPSPPTCTPPPPPQEEEITQPKTMNMETASPNNWVNMDQAPTPTPTPTLVATKSQRFPPVVTTVRVPFTEGFTFPVLNPHATSNVKLRVPNGVVLEDPPRDSLEVFRPPDDVAVEAKPPSFPFPPAAKSRVVVAGDDGDAASDASSDLFEIESFSTTATNSTYPMGYRRCSRDSFDEGSAVTECYEPSEASIEWSVTTADGYDEGGCGGGGVAGEQWKRKGGNGLLVSCRCEKAVSVGPQPVKCGEGQRGATSSWRHVSGVSSGGSNSIMSRVGGSVNKPPLARSSHHRSNTNTPRVTSLAFAT